MSKLLSRVLSMEVTYVIERKYTPKKTKKILKHLALHVTKERYVVFG